MFVRLVTVACVSTFLMLLHRLFPDPTLIHNMFPLNGNYPLTLDWYLFTLEWKVSICLFLWLVYGYAREQPRAERWVAGGFLVFWLKEIPEYVLFANQLPAIYDVLCFFAFVVFCIGVYAYDRINEQE